ncbi:MAG TPA: hypothetical protein VGX94_11910 [Terriglobia bacterium]|nr:hypothetical protein [Terriglobia bacterium]
MKTATSLVLVTVLCAAASGFGAQAEIDKLTPSNLSAFLKTFTSDADQVNDAFESMSKTKLPMFDAKGQTLGRRRIKDRQQTVVDLKKTLQDFKSRPENLVVAMTLSAQTEELADEIYDLTELAYDNDQEETAMRLTRLLGHFNDDASLIQAYALGLASQKEQRLSQLEKNTH